MLNNLIVQYPSHLLEEFAYNRGVIFLGAGVSSTSVNSRGERLPGWLNFINEAKAKIKLEHQDKIKYVDDMIKYNELLRALQIVQDYTDPGDYSKLVKDTFMARGFKSSPAHEILRNLNTKITVSTNFDNIYENFCKSINDDETTAYTSINYNDQANIIANIKSSENLIIKAHGSIESPNDLIFSQNEYYKAKREHALFYQILESLFLTQTVFFVGYSLNDPDINLLLSAEVNNINFGSPHYILLPETEIDKEIEKHWKNNYNVSIIPYKVSDATNKYENFIPSLEEFYDSIIEIQRDRGISPGAISSSA